MIDESELIKAGTEVAVERAIDLLRSLRNHLMGPRLRSQLNEALRELLKENPDLDKVRRAIRKAEEFKFDGDELHRVRKFLGPVEKPPPRSGKRVARKKASGGRTARKKKPTKKYRVAKKPTLRKSSHYSAGKSSSSGRSSSGKHRR